jgi:membrane protease YdiL (CAAX protease family)
MALLGPDFRAGLRHALYRPSNPAGVWLAIAIFLALLIVNQIVLQPAFAIGFAAITGSTGQSEFVRAALLSVLPAGLITAWLAWILARRRGADPRDVLALRTPALGGLGWAIVVGGFVIGLYALFGIAAWLAGFDIESSGLVEQAVMKLNNDPLYFLIAGGLMIGAPLAEEMTFRGQIFATLSQSRIGVPGASVMTAATWAAIHGATQPLHIVGLLFLMGLALAFLLVRFGSLWVTIACHAVWNGIQALALYAMAPQ